MGWDLLAFHVQCSECVFSKLKHTRPGLLSMANAGKDTNGMVYYILSSLSCMLTTHVYVGSQFVRRFAVRHVLSNLTCYFCSSSRPLSRVGWMASM